MTMVGDYHNRLVAARAEIDRLDREIIPRLLDRLQISAEIGRLRKGEGLLEVGGRDRGTEVLALYRGAQLSLEEAGTVSLEQIGLAILEQSASLQHRIIDAAGAGGGS
jgi:chorismate mutase